MRRIRFALVSGGSWSISMIFIMTRSLYSSESSLRIGAIALHGIHLPLPKSRSFGIEALAISLGILPVEDWEKESGVRRSRVNKSSRAIINKWLRFLILAI